MVLKYSLNKVGIVVPLCTMIRKVSFMIEFWISKLPGEWISWYCFMIVARKFAEAGQLETILLLQTTVCAWWGQEVDSGTAPWVIGPFTFLMLSVEPGSGSARVGLL